jgi:5'-nucleotidase
MSMLNYDAATIGNHDFDNGIDGLYAQLPHAKFELLSVNYDFKNTVLNGLVKKHKIFTFEGLKVGVYGLGIELKGLVNKELFKETRYMYPYALAQDAEKELKVYEKCDLVICISHLGYDYKNKDKPNDLVLAQKTEYTDLIIGGHTHTFLDKPTIVKNKLEKEVLVNQVGCYGINLGRIDFYFDDQNDLNADGVAIKV